MEKIDININDKICIIAPHPDDETFCCSGILIKYAAQTDVILLTYGETGNPEWSDSRTLRIRREEFRKVMNSVNVRNIYELSIPTGKVGKYAKKIRKLNLRDYDIIFVPNKNDLHKDHRASYEATKRIIRKGHTRVYQYEMWGTQINNAYIDITDVIDLKKRLMEEYHSQNQRLAYSEIIVAKNRYWSLEVKDNSCQYAELFFREYGPVIAIRHKFSLINEKFADFIDSQYI